MKLWEWTQPPDIRHPGSGRAFRDILVPKLLGVERNIKKISYSYAGQLREHFAQSAFDILTLLSAVAAASVASSTASAVTAAVASSAAAA